VTAASPYTKKDFTSDQMVRWCPGCGDYAILAQAQTVFASLGIPKEQFAVISGIGCSSRFPYYVDTYGFHTIHGRAPTVATGLKLTRPELSVWVVTGDGDALSIGGNHFLHAIRRNVDFRILLFNNRIYGLTKGQYSPTSPVGQKTKSTPMGSLDEPVEPLDVALGAKATFVARSVDVFATHLRDVMTAAAHHRGTALVEIYQNCNIFNDGAFDDLTNKTTREDRVLYVEHGKPLVWGGARRRGLVLDGLALRIVELADDADGSGCLVHDESNAILASLLVRMHGPEWPVAVGVLHRSERIPYDVAFHEQADQARVRLGAGDLDALLHQGDTWVVAP
jgi:2-oxoglutarate ferredoxin oxidoreductase subunit beta